MKIKVRYNINRITPKGTHTYELSVSPVAMYCPHCGQQDVWKDDGAGDYYVGPTHYCRSCLHIGHYMMEDYSYNLETDQSPEAQIFRAIAEA